MPINIIDNFNVNISKPIDSRMVVADSTERSNVPWKYDGLKVFQQDNRRTYVWNSLSSTWTIENELSLTDGFIPKFTINEFTNSTIYSTASYIGINTSIPKSELQINSTTFTGTPLNVILSSQETIISSNHDILNPFTSAKASSQIVFWNDGSKNGSISFRNRPSNGTFSSNEVYISNRSKIGIEGITNPSYSVHSGGSIGICEDIWFNNTSGSTSSNTRINFDGSTLSFKITGSNILQLLDDGTIYLNGGSGIYLNGGPVQITGSGADGVKIDSSTTLHIQRITSGNTYFGGPIRLPNGSLSNPTLSFSASTNTGIYSPGSSQISIVTSGVSRMSFNNSGASLIKTGYTNKFTVTLTAGLVRYLLNLSGAVSASLTNMASVTYDRVVYIFNGGSGTLDTQLYINDSGAGYVVVNRVYGYGGTCFIIPANREWRVYFEGGASGGTSTITIYGLGIG